MRPLLLQPAVGTHRAAVSELLAQLLRAEAPVVAQQVAASGVLRRCARVAVDHPNCSAIHGAVGRCLKLSLSKAVGSVGLWRQLLGSPPAAATGGAGSAADKGESLNLAVEAAAIAAAAQAAPTVGKRPANIGFGLAIAQLLHAAATGEVLGANGSQEQAGAAAEGVPAAAAAAAADAPSGMRRTPSSAGIARMGSGAVADLPGGEKDSWERQLAAQLAAAEPWVQLSSGPDCPLRRLLGEHQGDLGGPRPRPGVEPEPEEDTGDISQGQIIRWGLGELAVLGCLYTVSVGLVWGLTGAAELSLLMGGCTPHSSLPAG